jgi:ABC-type multidrug transport system ATPase subunit
MKDIRLEGLTKSFHTPQGAVQAVRGIDIEIARGETVALLGPNGAGKSTTIDMLLGLLPPDAGSVSLFGGRRARRSTPARSARCSRPARSLATSRCASSSR